MSIEEDGNGQVIGCLFLESVTTEASTSELGGGR